MLPAKLARVVVACGFLLLALSVSNWSAQLLSAFASVPPDRADPEPNRSREQSERLQRLRLHAGQIHRALRRADHHLHRFHRHSYRDDRAEVPPGCGRGLSMQAGRRERSVMLPDGNILYWDALEGTENVELSIVAEYGFVSENDQSRVLTLSPSAEIPSCRRGRGRRRSMAARIPTAPLGLRFCRRDFSAPRGPRPTMKARYSVPIRSSCPTG